MNSAWGRTLFLLLPILATACGQPPGAARYGENPALATVQVKTQATRTVTLRFDGGPDAAGKTDKLLDVLAGNDIHAIFFVTKAQLSLPSARATLQRMVDEGHRVVATDDGTYVGWQIDASDAVCNSVACVVDTIVAAVDGGQTGVIRLSTLSSASAAAIPTLVGALNDRGVNIGTTSNLAAN